MNRCFYLIQKKLQKIAAQIKNFDLFEVFQNKRILIVNQIKLKLYQQRLLLFHPIELQADPCHKYLRQEWQRGGSLQGSH